VHNAHNAAPNGDFEARLRRLEAGFVLARAAWASFPDTAHAHG
jgi:hypothetical protein